MLLAILLELTVVDLFRFIKDYWLFIGGVGGALYGQYKMLVGQNEKLRDDMKKERELVNNRLEEVEKCQDKNVPLFNDHLVKLKQVEDRVVLSHEIKFAHLESELNQMRISYEQRFMYHEQLVQKLEAKMDKFDEKLDKLLQMVAAKK